MLRTGMMIVFTAMCLAKAQAGSPATEGFKKLNGAEIKRAFTGHSFSDHTHYSFRYVADGSLQGMSMGTKISRRWWIEDDLLCLTDSFGQTCHDVWRKGAAIQLLPEGTDIPVEGDLE